MWESLKKELHDSWAALPYPKVWLSVFVLVVLALLLMLGAELGDWSFFSSPPPASLSESQSQSSNGRGGKGGLSPSGCAAMSNADASLMTAIVVVGLLCGVLCLGELNSRDNLDRSEVLSHQHAKRHLRNAIVFGLIASLSLMATIYLMMNGCKT